MTTGHVFMAMSLDGYVARSDRRLDWLMKQKTAGEDYGYDAFMAGMDAIVMGRVSFETVLGFPDWPYEKPVIVMSQQLRGKDIPGHLEGRVEVSDKSPEGIMKACERRGMRRVYVDGGALVQSFLRADLIEDMVVTIVPILLGEGRRLFGATSGDIDLDLIEARAYPSGLLRTQYRVRA